MCRGFIWFIFVFSCLSGYALSQAKSTLQDSVWQLINDGALVIDVRTQNEYNKGHLQGALLIPYKQIGDSIANIAPDTNRVIILYCASGIRSGIAEITIKKLGYINAINGGGYEGLKKAKSAIDTSVVR